MTTHLRPADAQEAAGIVAWAAAEGVALDVAAGGSKQALGRPAAAAARRLDISRLAGVIDYSPAELVLTARAATPMVEIAAMLAAERQMLAFEPPDLRALLGGDGEPTLGGVVACNLAGPRRVRAGAARDHFLGFAAINGWGDAWKAGGRVVKNVTGYDLCKLQAGAFGTLSVLTEISMKVLPAPETSCSLLLSGLDDAKAIPTLAQALNTPHEVSAAAHLPAAAAARAGFSGAATLIRLEGPQPSVAYRARALQALFPGAAVLPAGESVALWQAIGAVRALLPTGERIVWRVCPTPSAAPALLRTVQVRVPSAEGFYDWGGGLLWLSLPPSEDAHAAVVRAALGGAGHATLIVAPAQTRASVPVFEPEPAALAALGGRVKDSFDPRRVLNPGRMQEGR